MIKLYNDDCLEVMKEIPSKSVDMILCDLPYQVTKNKWDTIIPMNDYIIANDESLEKDEFYLKQFLKGLSKKEIDKIWKRNRLSLLTTSASWPVFWSCLFMPAKISMVQTAQDWPAMCQCWPTKATASGSRSMTER